MKSLLIVLFAALFGVPFVLAASTPAGDEDFFSADPKITNNEELATKDGFGAKFCLTDNEQFFLSWIPSEANNLNPVQKVQRHTPLFIALFFVDPGSIRLPTVVGRRPMVKTDVNYDFEVRRPDGSLYGEGKRLVAWSGRPPPLHALQLARTRTTITFEVIDPPGWYTINLIVRDDVRKVAVGLRRKILVEE